MKQAFSYLELILVLILLSTALYFIFPKPLNTQLHEASSRLLLYLKQTRYLATIDQAYRANDPLWHKGRWTLKFFRCRQSVGGIYYSIYKDVKNSSGKYTGHPSKQKSLKDPLTKKDIYSSNQCQQTSTNSAYTLLTKNYNIVDVLLSCNSTSSLGQLSFSKDGRVYSKLSNKNGDHYAYEIKQPCKLSLIHKNGESKTIIIEPKTGFTHY